MNFAPYQDEHPELERALSPPPRNRQSLDTSRPKSPPARSHPITRGISEVQSLPPPDTFADHITHHRHASLSNEERHQHLEAFETSLPLRLDYEAMLAYLLLPPAGGVLLLLLEHKSDYVRFHAWQSSMLFSAMFIVHLLLLWSRILSWLLFGVDLLLIGFLTMHAYRDVENLDHYEVPIFGRLANGWVENE